MDWNWFFSSFCQSAAALIGIIGAFIISRLLGLQERATSKISDFDNLIIEFNELILKINSRHFHWFTKTHVKYSSNLREQIKAGDFENLSKEEILLKIYALDDRLYKIDEAILEGFNYAYEKHRPKYTDMGNGISLKNTIPTIDFPHEGLWSDLEAEQNEILKLKIQSQVLIQKFYKNSQEIKSFDKSIISLKILIIISIIIFPLTVIYPLHFLPLSTNSAPIITFNIFSILNSLYNLKMIL